MANRIGVVTGLLLVPAVAFYLVFALGPMAVAGYLSFLNWDGVSQATWAGLSNWGRLFADPLTGLSIWLTVKMVVLSWLVQTPISLLLGLFLAGRQRYRSILGVFYFFPLLFSAVAIGLIWIYILDPNFGALNTALSAIGASGLTKNWLGNPNIAFYTMVLVIAWMFIPFHTLLYQAGVRQIPEQLYEAAALDGAGTLAQFRHITLPQLKYTVVTSSILIVTGSATYFDLIFVMTGGGPGFATRILPLHMYITAFEELNVGYGSALAVLLAAIGLTMSLVLLKITGFSEMESQQEGL